MKFLKRRRFISKIVALTLAVVAFNSLWALPVRADVSVVETGVFSQVENTFPGDLAIIYSDDEDDGIVDDKPVTVNGVALGAENYSFPKNDFWYLKQDYLNKLDAGTYTYTVTPDGWTAGADGKVGAPLTVTVNVLNNFGLSSPSAYFVKGVANALLSVTITANENTFGWASAVKVGSTALVKDTDFTVDATNSVITFIPTGKNLGLNSRSAGDKVEIEIASKEGGVQTFTIEVMDNFTISSDTATYDLATSDFTTSAPGTTTITANRNTFDPDAMMKIKNGALLVQNTDFSVVGRGETVTFLPTGALDLDSKGAGDKVEIEIASQQGGAQPFTINIADSASSGGGGTPGVPDPTPSATGTAVSGNIVVEKSKISDQTVGVTLGTGATGVASVKVAGVTVDPSDWSFANGALTIKASLLEKFAVNTTYTTTVTTSGAGDSATFSILVIQSTDSNTGGTTPTAPEPGAHDEAPETANTSEPPVENAVLPKTGDTSAIAPFALSMFLGVLVVIMVNRRKILG